MKRMRSSLKTILSLSLATILLAMVSTGYAQQKNTPKHGGTLRIGTAYDVATLNTFASTGAAESYVRSLIFEGLTSLDKDLNLLPGLARSWEISKDGKTYTFHLRKGVKFHNGKEMDAEDVKWTVAYIMDPKNRARSIGVYLGVGSVEAVDKHTVRFRLKGPDPSFLVSVSIRRLVIIPKDSELSPESFPPGTGPFEFVEWRAGDHLTLKRFNAYWQKGLPLLDMVILKPVTDENVRLTALRAGDLDIALGAPSALVDSLIKGKLGGIRVSSPTGFNPRLIRFNVTKPPFNETKVRQAIAFALDKKEILSGTMWGHGEVTNQIFPRSSFWYLNVPDRSKDLKKAKELLAEAGYPKGFKINLPSYRDSLDVALLVKDQLAKVKITVDIELMDRSAYRIKRRKRDFAMLIVGASKSVDPNEVYFRYFYSKLTNDSNESGYANPALDKLMEEANLIHDPKKRKALYTKALEIIQREVPEIYLTLEHNYAISRPHVKSFTPNGMDTIAHFAGGGLAHTWLAK